MFLFFFYLFQFFCASKRTILIMKAFVLFLVGSVSPNVVLFISCTHCYLKRCLLYLDGMFGRSFMLENCVPRYCLMRCGQAFLTIGTQKARMRLLVVGQLYHHLAILARPAVGSNCFVVHLYHRNFFFEILYDFFRCLYGKRLSVRKETTTYVP